MFLRCFSGGGVDEGVEELVAVGAPVGEIKEKRTVAVSMLRIVFTVLCGCANRLDRVLGFGAANSLDRALVFGTAHRLDRALVPGAADKSAF